jgi:hypothetical protein
MSPERYEAIIENIRAFILSAKDERDENKNKKSVKPKASPSQSKKGRKVRTSKKEPQTGRKAKARHS